MKLSPIPVIRWSGTVGGPDQRLNPFLRSQEYNTFNLQLLEGQLAHRGGQDIGLVTGSTTGAKNDNLWLGASYGSVRRKHDTTFGYNQSHVNTCVTRIQRGSSDDNENATAFADILRSPFCHTDTQN